MTVNAHKIGDARAARLRRYTTLALLAWAVLAPSIVAMTSCTTPWIQDPKTLAWRRATVAETQHMIDITGKQLAQATDQAIGSTYTPAITAITQLAALIFAWTVRPPKEPTPPTPPKKETT